MKEELNKDMENLRKMNQTEILEKKKIPLAKLKQNKTKKKWKATPTD
jgi:hypothetical protein